MPRETQSPELGAKVRALRQKRRITQAELARRLGISASYLNLIERGGRSLTAPLLVQIAREFDLDLADFAADTDARVIADLMEVFADPMFDPHGLTSAEVRDLASASPSVGRAIVGLYRAFRESQTSAASLASRIYDDQQVPDVEPTRMPSEEMNEFVQRNMNHFPELETAAERLWVDAKLRRGDLFFDLSQYLRREHGVEVDVSQAGSSDEALRHYDPDRRRLTLSETLPAASRAFQLAAQVGLLEHHHYLDDASQEAELSSEAARSLCRVVLANYYAAAVVMPYTAVLDAATRERYDLEVLGHRFGVSFEQICHRLTTLRRPGAEGVPLHMIRVDLAGNISKRFSASGIHFAKFSGACSRWNVFSAFLTPGMIRVQLSEMPDGVTYFCMARTIPKGRGGYHAPHTVQAIGLGCHVDHARKLVYSDGVDLDTLESALKVGVTCRLCERADCEQRAFPSIREPLKIDENVRGVSFFAPATTLVR